MIIDGRVVDTTAMRTLEEIRQNQIAALKDVSEYDSEAGVRISADEIRESLENNQIRIQ